MINQVISERFTKLYDETYKNVLKFVVCNCSSMDDVEDIVQSIYLELLKLLRRNIYFNKTDDRNIRIAFSNRNRPLRDYYFGELNRVNSKIRGYDLIIYQFDNSYFVEFKYDGCNYDIETNNITLEELTILLTTIIK